MICAVINLNAGQASIGRSLPCYFGLGILQKVELEKSSWKASLLALNPINGVQTGFETVSKYAFTMKGKYKIHVPGNTQYFKN